MYSDKVSNKNDSEQGVSPVVGVILMVAITVILAAVIGTFVLDLGGTETTAQAGISMSETSDGTHIQWISSGNVETISIQVDGEEVGTLDTVGDSGTATSPADSSVTAVGVTEDGSESVVSSSDSPSDTGTAGFVTNQISEPTESVTGVVSVNPRIEGAIVESRDSDGNVVDTTTTNADGEYEVGVFEDGSILVNVDGVNVNETDFYAGYELSVTNVEEDINFNFTNVQSTTVNGDTVDVSYVIEGESENQIANVYQLQAVNENLSADYVLVNNIDANETSSWNSGEGFVPLGDADWGDRVEENGYSGTFDGQGHAIDNLTIDVNQFNIGLFGFAESNATIENVSVENASITGDSYAAGGIIGATPWDSTNITVSNVSVSGNITSGSYVGGVVGDLNGGTIINSSSEASVTANDGRAGGLVASFDGTMSDSYATGDVVSTATDGGLVGGLVAGFDGTMSDSYATGDVVSTYTSGGLVGYNNGSITDSYATGDVESTASFPVGGFAGQNRETISNSYATGNVTGDNRVGGFVGSNRETISNSYATGNVTGDTEVGGLAGLNTELVENSYSTGDVTGDTEVGGFIGNNYGSTTDSYWDIDASGQSTSYGGTGLTTSEMTGEDAESNMTGFDFTTVWETVDGDYPQLQSE